MNIVPASHGLDATLGASSGLRSGGVHISDVYNSLYQELEPARYAQAGGPPVIKMAMGLAWEAYVEACLRRAGIDAYRPEEGTTPEGLAFSPDLILIDERGIRRVGEIKLTYMSESETLGEPKFAKWLTQVQAYCHHMGTSSARFYVLFVNGNYRGQRDPVFRAYDMTFTAQELKDNWQLLLNHARHKKML